MSDNKSAVSHAGRKWFAKFGYEVPKYNIVTSDFSIMPNDMPAQFDHLWSAFEHHETEVSAAYILRFCQEQGSWAPFSEKQINAFYKRNPKRGSFTFNRLIEPDWNYVTINKKNLSGGGWIVKDPVDKLFYMTDEFIECVHRSLTKK